MSASRTRPTGARRNRIQLEHGTATTYRAVAPPLLGFVRTAHDPAVVHLTYRTLHEACGRASVEVPTLCGQQVTPSGADGASEDPPPPCPMCLDTAMNDTAGTDVKAG